MQKQLPRKAQPIFLVLVIALAVSACNRQNLPPVIRLNSPDTVYSKLGNSVAFPEAVAFDREDHDLSSEIEVIGAVNKDSVGFYRVTYKVTDSDGNEGNADLVVRVAHGIEGYVGMFDSSNNCATCPSTGSTTIDSVNQGGAPYLNIRTPMGTGVAWGYYLSFNITPEGKTSFIGAQLECFYDVDDATIAISDNTDTVTVDLLLRARSGALSNCTSVYVRQ